MKALLFDIGNTRIKARLLGDGVGRDLQPVEHCGDETRALEELLKQVDASEVGSVHLASVQADANTGRFVDFFRKALDVEAQLYRSESKAFGLSNSYQVPEQLGVDRWLAMVAAFRQEGRAVCVVDCGSALTVDAVDGNGVHLGGFIVPGQRMMIDSLLSGTGKVRVEKGAPDIPDASQALVFGRNTEEAVTWGALFAAVAFVNKCIVDMQSRLKDTCSVVLTGGDSASLLPYVASESTLAEGLVLDGLQIYATEQGKVNCG